MKRMSAKGFGCFATANGMTVASRYLSGGGMTIRNILARTVVCASVLLASRTSLAAPPKPALTQDVTYPMATLTCQGNGNATTVSCSLPAIAASKRFVASYISYLAFNSASCALLYVQLIDTPATFDYLPINPLVPSPYSGSSLYYAVWEPGQTVTIAAVFTGGCSSLTPNATTSLAVSVRGHYEPL